MGPPGSDVEDEVNVYQELNLLNFESVERSRPGILDWTGTDRKIEIKPRALKVNAGAIDSPEEAVCL
ncbi:hypothetical protein NHX12_027627 [Muraenolepis orangiensis]|uniref:Uncharacterized protein n=1 Tax=Muraenolepis orangiensis TaxID=630683 RepID=A0A9Q0EJB2_9TELE|nr:hypothetical protein NHX12_027627 [Muraenolepis orangiensis]